MTQQQTFTEIKRIY